MCEMPQTKFNVKMRTKTMLTVEKHKTQKEGEKRNNLGSYQPSSYQPKLFSPDHHIFLFRTELCFAREIAGKLNKITGRRNIKF